MKNAPASSTTAKDEKKDEEDSGDEMFDCIGCGS